MRNILILLIGLTSFSLNLKAQETLLNYDWENNPTVHELTEEEKTYSEVYIKYHAAAETFFSDEGNAYEYYLRHSLIHLNDADAVDDNNKVYMPGTFADPDIFHIVEKARVIKQDGSVLELNVDDILEEVNEEEGVKYRYFALEGIEIGDEVEYFYIYPRAPKLYGTALWMQSSNYKREATVTIITPSNLENKFLSLNGFPEMVQDSSYDENYFSATATNLPGLDEDESFASYNASRAGITYYLYKNHYNNKTFDFYSRMSSALADIFDEINPKKSKLLKVIKGMDLDENLSDEEKIIFVENYYKKNFVYIEEGMAELSDLATLTKKKYGNEIAFLQLFGATFDELDIKYEVVYTCDRSDYEFMEDFKSQLYVQELLFYFPETDKYLAPVGINTRYGFPPGNLTNNKGLFTRFINIGGNKAGVGKVKFIEPVPAEETMDRFTITLDINDFENTKSTLNRELTGYDALTYQVLLDLMDEENRTEMEESLVKYIDEDMELGEMEVKNASGDDFGKKPLQVIADFSSKQFIKKAGKNYLINVGLMIGPQAELYQENTRQMDVSQQFNRGYHRTIIITIPEGYEVANLENLNMDVRTEKDGKKDMGFVSSYDLDGNTLTVTVEEYYNTIDYPIEEYPTFEKQINAAADFNKVAILLKKL